MTISEMKLLWKRKRKLCNRSYKKVIFDINECYYVFINPYFCKVEKEERSYKNYKEVKVMNKSVQRKVQLKIVIYEVIIMKLIYMTLC